MANLCLTGGIPVRDIRIFLVILNQIFYVMTTIKQIQELRPAKLKSIAKEATSAGFAKALKSNLAIVYTEGDVLVERQPGGKKIKLAVLKHEKRTIANKFKLK